VMAPGLFLGPGMVERFRQEAVTVANLSHPNIITIHSVRQVEDLHFLVMKFIEGRSLDAVLRSGATLSIGAIRAILHHVGNGLAYAHRRGVIHRDIKPGNILLDADGNAIVTDFGIAKLAEQTGYTQTGAMIGTPPYMSPEQCQSGPLTWSSDLYSLGIVAFELLTGDVPFSGTVFEVMRGHSAEPPPSIRERRADCPPELEAAVQRMLAKSPDDRFDTMAAALDALGAAPLAQRDPVRTEIERLAIPDPAVRAASAIGPVVSPVPRIGPRVGRLTILNHPDVVAAGEQFELRATVRSDTGATLPGRVVTWTSSDDTVAAVSASGAVTARAPGRVNITATCEGVLASLPITVLPAGAAGSKSARRNRAALFVAAALAVVVVGAGGYMIWRAGRPAPSPLAAGTPAGNADSTASLASAEPPPPPPTPAPVVSAPARGAPPDAVTHDANRSPSARQHAVDTVARGSDAPPPASATTVPPPPPPPSSIPQATSPVVAAPVPIAPPAAPPVVSAAAVTRAVDSVVRNYVAAIRARSIDQMRQLYPFLAADRAAEWQSQFNLVGHGGVEQLQVTLAGNPAITPAANGQSANARFTVKLLLKLSSGSDQSSTVNFNAALRRDGDQWHIEALDQRAAP
ncbi:MAG: protein kinase domain-containing protein, partial [Gemmatimonadales bacterium]